MAPTATHTSVAPTPNSTAETSGKGLAGSLTPAQIDRYQRDGYLIIPNFFKPSEILAHARSLIRDFDPKNHPLTKFTTGEGQEEEEDSHVGDRYFLESGDKIRYFLEEGSIDASTGKLNRQPDLCVNKAGHALHVLDSTFYQLSFSTKVQNLVGSLGSFVSPEILQSMIICKQPSIGGAVPSHNDSTFLYTNPPSAMGLWFALEDCTKSNGCLSFQPGSHRWPSGENKQPSPPSSSFRRPETDSIEDRQKYGTPRGVNKRFVRSEPGNVDSGTTFEVLSTEEEDTWDDSRAIVEECKAGTLVLIHGSVLHKSEKNLSDVSRYIYTFHCIEGKAEYDNKNWLQPTAEMPFTKLYDPPQEPTRS